MVITVNGSNMELAPGTTLAALLDELGLSRTRVAVEHNRRILAPDSYAGTALGDGDVLEILSFVGGG